LNQDEKSSSDSEEEKKAEGLNYEGSSADLSIYNALIKEREDVKRERKVF